MYNHHNLINVSGFYSNKETLLDIFKNELRIYLSFLCSKDNKIYYEINISLYYDNTLDTKDTFICNDMNTILIALLKRRKLPENLK